MVKNVLDADGDLSIVQSKKNQAAGFTNYADSFTYTAAGAVSSMQLGNGKWESTSFNSRLQPTQIALGTTQNGTDKLKLNFDYGTTTNNGNVLSQTITVPTTGSAAGFTAIQNYTYDNLNRLKSATETIGGGQSWKQTFLYDRYGNRNFDAANTTTLGSCSTAQCNPSVDVLNNRFTSGQGYTYDLAGNVITDAQGRTFTFDGENKQTKVVAGGNTVGEYFYDGDGKRVKKVAGTETTIFVYDASGKMVAEYATTVSPTPQVSYLTSDHLGSPRITTDANGNVFSRRDFLPFGEELTSAQTAQRNINLNYGEDGLRQKFTIYERDNETDLDFAQARYHNYNLGRFQSPDPLMASARKRNPQTFNRYSYVTNNPLNLIDPFGLSGCDPKTDPNCAEVGPDGTPAQLKTSGDPGVLGVVTISASAVLEAISTTAAEISTQIVPRALEGISSFAQVGAEVLSVPGAILFMTTPVGGPPSNCEAAADMCGTRTVPQTEHQPDTQNPGEPFPISPTTTGTPDKLDRNSIVVRGGESDLPPPGTVFSGAFGTTIPDAAAFVPHGQIRWTTLRAIEESGGSVVPIPEMTRGGNMNYRHVNIVEGSRSTFSPLMPNPVPKANRIQ